MVFQSRLNYEEWPVIQMDMAFSIQSPNTLQSNTGEFKSRGNGRDMKQSLCEMFQSHILKSIKHILISFCLTHTYHSYQYFRCQSKIK